MGEKRSSLSQKKVRANNTVHLPYRNTTVNRSEDMHKAFDSRTVRSMSVAMSGTDKHRPTTTEQNRGKNNIDEPDDKLETFFGSNEHNCAEPICFNDGNNAMGKARSEVNLTNNPTKGNKCSWNCNVAQTQHET